MYEASSVLTGQFAAPNYSVAANNLSSSAATSGSATDDASASSAGSVDQRRYTKYDHSESETGTIDMSFDDVLDMVNPLQHIPVVSSVYRAVTGETINPVSRIVGDMAYSGPLGIISVMASGVSAIANSVLEAETGKDVTGTVVAALFGDDDAAPATADGNTNVKVADADNAAAQATADTDTETKTSETQTNETETADATTAEAATTAKEANAAPVTASPLPAPAPAKPVFSPSKVAPASIASAATVAAATLATNSNETANAPASSLAGATRKFLPLDRNRVAARSMADAATTMQNEDRIMQLSQGSHAMRLGHTIYTSPLMNGPKPIPFHMQGSAAANATAASAANSAMATGQPQNVMPKIIATTPNNAASSDASGNTAAPAETQAQPITMSRMSSLLNATQQNMSSGMFNDVTALKRLDQYKNLATAPVTNGATLDLTN